MTLTGKTNFSKGDTAQMTGTTQKQIRNWEARGDIPKADRVVSGVEHVHMFGVWDMGVIL